MTCVNGTICTAFRVPEQADDMFEQLKKESIVLDNVSIGLALLPEQRRHRPGQKE